jgi:hypothetical protein
MFVLRPLGSRGTLASFLLPLLAGAACDGEHGAAPALGAGVAAGSAASSAAGASKGGSAAATDGGAPEAGGTTTTKGGSSGGSARGGSTSAGGSRGGSTSAGSAGSHVGGDNDGNADAGASPGPGGTGSTGSPTDGGEAGEPTAGTSNNGGSGGAENGDARLDTTVESGDAAIAMEPRPGFGAMILAKDGERVYAVESRRDDETGPFNLPWRSRFRVAAYDDGVEAWAYAAEPDDVVSDVVVHPSGDVTIAVLRQAPERMAYDLLRFEHDGTLLGTTTLAEPETTPDADLGAVARPMFRMKSDFADAMVGGWVRLVPDGEGLVAAILSYIDRPSTDPLSARWALGLEAFDWDAPAFAERWARVVEGAHRAQPVAWSYDEFRWDEQAVRPFLARDDVSGDLLVGRGWNNLRCEANVAVFGELTHEDCVLGSVGELENERVPLAVTRFTATGARKGTTILAPDADAPEQVAFALAGHDQELYVAGSVVRENPDGSRRTYSGGFVDYDGYIAVYDADGAPLRHHDYNLGRGDVLAALRLTPDGVVAVGAAGWDRAQGGMSVFRGADPVLAWLSSDGTRATTRVLPMSNGSRHYNLHDLVVTEAGIVAHGVSDAPMTHSADGGNNAARTFGALRIRLTPP